jgi:hypothetical protein
MEVGDSILHVASEMAPFSKTGGLADVASGLPRALVGLGFEVTVVTPRYRGIELSDSLVARLAVPLGTTVVDASFHETVDDLYPAWSSFNEVVISPEFLTI